LSVLVILNGISRKKDLFYRRIYPALKQRFDAEVWETQHAGHAEQLASLGVVKGFDIILSAGGDGTMHQVVNGVMHHDKPTLLVGLIPLGSGNDLARALGALAESKAIIDHIDQRRTRLIDVGWATAQDESGTQVKRFFINECSIGMGPEVVRRLNERGRSFGPALMYLKSIVATFVTHKPEHLRVEADGWNWSGKSRVTAIANGKAFGHGNYIAPNSSVTDGLLNLFIAANPSLLRFLMLLQALKRPSQSGDKCLTYRTSKRIAVTSDKRLPVEADGEALGFLPLTCEVAARKLNFLCSP
jgi:diacylglycerol kinase (ATP)